MSGGQSAITRLFPFLTIFSILFSLLVAPASSRAGCDPGWPECRDLRQTIQDRRNRTATPCDQALDLMVVLQTGTWEFRTRVKHLVETYRAAAERIQARPRQFEEMEARHRDLAAQALREGLVVPAGAQTPKTPAAGVWGEARGAMTFDPVLARKAAAYRTEMGMISLRWEEEARAYEDWAARETARFNDWLVVQVARLESLAETQRADSGKLIALFDSGRYPHCLGLPWSVQAVTTGTDSPASLQEELRAAAVDGGPAEAAGARVREAEARLIRVPGELPGINPPLPAVTGVFAPLTAPKAPLEPEEVKLLGDGAAQVKAAAELQKARIEGERFMLASDAIDAIKYPLKTGKDLARSIYIDTPAALVKPLGDFLALDDRPLDLALADLAVGYADLGYAMTIGMVEHAAKNAWEITSDLANESAAINGYLYGLYGDRSLAGDLSQAFTGLRDYFGRIQELGLAGLAEEQRPYPGDGASPADYQAYLESADRELESVAGARQRVQSLSEWVNAHVADNTRKAVEVYMAGEMGRAAAAHLRPRAEALAESFKIADHVAELRQKNLERFVSEQKLAKELLARQEAGQAVPGEALDLARKVTENGPRELARRMDQIAEADAFLEKLLEDRAAAREPAATDPAGNVKPDSGVDDLFRDLDKADKPLAIDGRPVDKFIAQGSFKSTFEHPTNPGKVVQTFKTTEKPLQDQALARQELTRVRLEEAGVGHTAYEVQQLPDGTRIQVADRVPGDAIAENLIKDGRFTAEHAEALRVAMRKLNDHDMIATDPNPGNIYFERGPAGVLEAKFLDIDGVVRTREIIKDRGTGIVNTGGGLDLAKPAAIAALQKLILDGPFENGMQNLMNRYVASEIGHALGTKWYSGAHPSGQYFTPTSVGTFGEALAKVDHPAMAPKEALAKAVADIEAAEAGQHIFLENRNQQRAEAARQVEDQARAVEDGLDLLTKQEVGPTEAGKDWSGFDLLGEMGPGFDLPLPSLELPPGLH